MPRKHFLIVTLILITMNSISIGNTQQKAVVPLPLVQRVDRQPLISQLHRLSQALMMLGQPLPEKLQKELNSATGGTDDARITANVQRVLDPLCLAAVRIPRGKSTHVTANPSRHSLIEQGWRTYLIKVINEAGVTSPLQLKSENARPLVESPLSEVSKRWLDIESFDHPPLLADLSGLGLEYRVVSLYSKAPGTRPAILSFYVRRQDWGNIRDHKSEAASHKLWTFRQNTGGWQAEKDCRLNVKDGHLHVQTEVNDPYMTSAVHLPGGQLRLRMRLRTDHEDVGQVFWATDDRPQMDGSHQAVFSLSHLDGKWQECSIPFKTEGDLRQLRIDLGSKAGRLDIDWIEIVNEDAPGSAWVQLPLKLHTASSVPVKLSVRDQDGNPTTACFLIRDKQGRVFPSQAKRLAPDFYFQPQVYRRDGEILRLPEGSYTVVCSRGPESLPETRTLLVGSQTKKFNYQVKRWIDPASLGWWSGDHHIHAAGCAHYSNPTEGVLPADMQRHIEGEDLKVGCNLTWGPCFDYQKKFFTGRTASTSSYPYLLRYDIEVSGFGSHQSGHLCLLRLKNQIYPGGVSKDHWPTLCLNTLRWAKQQGAICGTAHSAIGLSGSVGRVAEKDGPDGLPSYSVPNFDGIGAMEYIADVTHEVPGPDNKLVPAIDFLATMNTSRKEELNIWYHTLNCGFRTRISGETDFPCLTGERVGKGRSYVKLDGRLDFDNWCEGIKKGRCYVSDGRSHLPEYQLNGLSLGEKDSELLLDKAGNVGITVKTAARMKEPGDPDSVPVEVVINGYPVAQKMIPTDGVLRDVQFSVPVEQSSWITVRILGSSHTNPFFVLIDGKPIRASRRSVQWCLRGVDQCWSQKERFYNKNEKEEAKAVYEHARNIYRQRLTETVAE